MDSLFLERLLKTLLLNTKLLKTLLLSWTASLSKHSHKKHVVSPNSWATRR